ncbi:hypothetical protein BXZ70DRAFT_955272 [Cristinia sonorae]|uniref:Nab2 type CCCH zinc finger 4 domain-containing protein n=1 Tax=Cristinia sonorae TaxID=1940300 RepID=A0A8K0UHB4_9AGAR|nr:hypothetical protein BXZ70DRAFT_955272 [Cristinia sonorae]
MAYGLTIGTERATALQNAIQEELTTRGYSPEGDHVMAEYITIMIINNKTAAQISTELEDLIGSDFDPNFVDWLFSEVEKTSPESEAAPPPAPEPIPSTSASARDPPPHLSNDASRRSSAPARPSAPLYQQAISQAIPTSSDSRKRTRSKSPGHANKSRRMDLPTGPRAMQRDGSVSGGVGSRSLLDRMGPNRGGHPSHGRDNNRIDNIQARIDSITNNASPDMAMMMPGGPGPFPMNGVPGMDMNMAAASMGNPLMLQEMMMNQMMLMQQMAGAMGMLPGMGPMMNGGMPMQPGIGGDSGMGQGNMNGGPPVGMDGRGRGRGRGGNRGVGRGRGGHAGGSGAHTAEESSAPVIAAPSPAPAAAPAPVVPSNLAAAASAAAQVRPGFVPPERPQSPTLCKFALKCTNPLCRWSHPSPVATAESGVVLSNDPCENGKNCKDKDCIKAHVSPAVLNPSAVPVEPKPAHFAPAPAAPASTQTPCRFGNACTRPNCAFLHPTRTSTTPCRFGTACTRANCTFQHPEGRVLPSTFHRGLSTTGGLVSVATPEAGSIGAASHNKSMTFNKGSASAADLQKQLKEMEEKKSQAQAAVAQAQAAAGKKEDGTKSVPISA